MLYSMILYRNFSQSIAYLFIGREEKYSNRQWLGDRYCGYWRVISNGHIDIDDIGSTRFNL